MTSIYIQSRASKVGLISVCEAVVNWLLTDDQSNSPGAQLSQCPSAFNHSAGRRRPGQVGQARGTPTRRSAYMWRGSLSAVLVSLPRSKVLEIRQQAIKHRENLRLLPRRPGPGRHTACNLTTRTQRNPQQLRKLKRPVAAEYWLVGNCSQKIPTDHPSRLKPNPGRKIGGLTMSLLSCSSMEITNISVPSRFESEARGRAASNYRGLVIKAIPELRWRGEGRGEREAVGYLTSRDL